MRIKPLEWETVPNASVCVFIGRRKSGKTVNIMDMFFKKRHAFTFGLVFCGSKKTIKQYENHFPSSFIYDGYHPKVLLALFEKQERDVELGIAKPVFVLVDDCSWAKKSIVSDPTIRRVFMNGRHALIFFVLSMQYCMDLPPALRGQIDYTFLSRDKSPQSRQKLYDNYNVCFRSFAEFDAVMKKFTINHSTMVLCSGDTESDEPEDNVFWWKSQLHDIQRIDRRTGRPIPPYRVNARGTWWKYHRKRFNKRYFLSLDDQEKGGKKGGRKGKKGQSDFVITKVPVPRRAPRMPMQRHPPPRGRRQPPMPRQSAQSRRRQPPSSTHTPNAAKWMQRERTQNLGQRRSGLSLM